MRTVYVNGQYVPENEATISIFDRSFLFADGVYEVTSVLDGKLIDFNGHMTRLARSLSELGFTYVPDIDELLAVHRELVKRNNVTEGLVYLQVSRGSAGDRDFAINKDTPATLVLFTQSKSLIKSALAERGQKILTYPDVRWRRSDIKTVQLLYASLLKTEAAAKGADDAWMVLDGYITEGSSNNAYIVTKDNVIVTRQLSNDILHGITRKAVLKCADELQLKVEERLFTVDEVLNAKEAFSTSASAFVCPVAEVDGTKIGDGKPGPIAKRLREIYIEANRAAAI
ncbi:D-amino-acid transaminase [Thalassospira alkalitolerans]|uniref:Probable branched-chain-amino-acid aminotransferase n=1 Tax=Thalassospira alkalitolerans TaxID=1293890 RepID=A0A1Y2LAX0_9PROT|nr:D-amino-acid transaminase [Thalassospira alkalitolerans]OSQ47419.1 D-amino acid aminotransferase [Thalassospira alkalitolerans]